MDHAKSVGKVGSLGFCYKFRAMYPVPSKAEKYIPSLFLQTAVDNQLGEYGALRKILVRAWIHYLVSYCKDFF